MKLTEQQVTDAADIAERWIRLRAVMQDVPGVSYGITHAGRTVRLGALGVSDLDAGRPATPDDGTCYRVASISKTVTATLTMQLVERGRLRLDDPVSAHLPWLRSALPDGPVTIRHLLTHSGGIIRDGSNAWGDHDFPDPQAFRREVRERATFGPPSTTFRYSNVAYALLGEILEATTGRPFRDLVRRRIVRPLGLTATGSTLVPGLRSRLATGYYPRRPGEPRRQTQPTEARAFEPAGGLISNVPDLLAYQQAHMAGDRRLLADAGKLEMQRAQWQRREEPHYGLGWMVWSVEGIALSGHSGGYPGFTTKIAFAPALGVATAVLTNAIAAVSGEAVDVVFHTIGRVKALWDDAGETGHGHSRRSVARFVGIYRGDWGELIVGRVNRSLVLVDPETTTPLKDAARLSPRGRRSFLIVENDDFGFLGEVVSFVLDRRGRSTALRYGPHTLVRADV